MPSPFPAVTAPTNAERAERARAAFQTYQNHRHVRATNKHVAKVANRREDLVGLMADLAHLADSFGLSGTGCLQSAGEHHHHAETHGGD